MRYNAYSYFSRWEVLIPEAIHEWSNSLDTSEYDHYIAALEELRDKGPNLKRPLVGKIEGSKYKNMKELIPMSGNFRILFVFDPKRKAVLLVAGDKTNNWEKWYKKNIPIAEQNYETYLKEIGERNG